MLTDTQIHVGFITAGFMLGFAVRGMLERWMRRNREWHKRQQQKT